MRGDEVQHVDEVMVVEKGHRVLQVTILQVATSNATCKEGKKNRSIL